MPARIWLLTALTLAACAGITSAADNPLLKTLLEQGVPVGAGPAVKLPPVKLPDGLTAEEQQPILKSLVNERHPLDQMLRKHASAPFQFKLIYGEKDFPGAKSARRVDLYFFAYGDLDLVSSEGFWKEQGEGPKKDDTTVKILDAAELATRKLTLPPDGDDKERFGVARMRIFDTVEVSGGGRAVKTQSPESVVLALAEDRRFDRDPEFPNQWRKLVRDQATAKLAPSGTTHPYSGMAAYVKATQLKNPSGVLLIEYHLLFDEPDGWFEGAKLLSTKLPILTQDNVVQFRKDLEKKMKEKSGTATEKK